MSSAQSKIKQIMKIGDIGKREIELRKLGQKYGISFSSTYSGSGDKHREEEVIRRIQEAERSIRENRLWWVAVIASITSVFSAFAAWLAVYFSNKPYP